MYSQYFFGASAANRTKAQAEAECVASVTDMINGPYECSSGYCAGLIYLNPEDTTVGVGFWSWQSCAYCVY